MTPSDLKYHVEKGTDSHFFERSSMKFFGDTMKNYGVRATTIKVSYNEAGEYTKEGVTAEVWELYRKKPGKHGLKDSSYFCKSTFSRRFPTK